MSKQKDQQPDINRRRILRGMASAPVIVTLSNGAQGAVASNFACINKNGTALQDAVVADPVITQNAAPPAWCAPLSELDATTAPDPAGFYRDTLPPDSSYALMTTDGAPPDQACVLYVDHNGAQITSSTLDPSAGDPITASCYTSFI